MHSPIITLGPVSTSQRKERSVWEIFRCNLLRMLNA